MMKQEPFGLVALECRNSQIMDEGFLKTIMDLESAEIEYISGHRRDTLRDEQPYGGGRLPYAPLFY
ncbi:MAG: hypothetical protein C5B59_08790 [Bacteroidetes bacterium]|nr:MAG: hypothetical protein C5B59_08790 [Bacteroidota bacterium]